MAEGGMEMGETGEAEAPDDVETSFMNISAQDSENTHHLEETLSQYTGDSQVSQRGRLKRSKVKAWVDVIEFKFEGRLAPAPAIYTKFELDTDGRTLLPKEGRIRVTDVRNPNLYLALSSLEKKVGVDYIRSHLFPEYTSRRTRGIEQQHVATTRLQRVDESATAALRGFETVELVDLPQRVSDVTGALATLTQQELSFDSQLSMREILGLNEALKRTSGALVDNIAKLSQLDADITQAERELGGSETAKRPGEKAPHTGAA